MSLPGIAPIIDFIDVQAVEGDTTEVTKARLHLQNVVLYVRQQDTYLKKKYGPDARKDTPRYELGQVTNML